MMTGRGTSCGAGMLVQQIMPTSRWTGAESAGGARLAFCPPDRAATIATRRGNVCDRPAGAVMKMPERHQLDYSPVPLPWTTAAAQHMVAAARHSWAIRSSLAAGAAVVLA